MDFFGFFIGPSIRMKLNHIGIFGLVFLRLGSKNVFVPDGLVFLGYLDFTSLDLDWFSTGILDRVVQSTSGTKVYAGVKLCNCSFALFWITVFTQAAR